MKDNSFDSQLVRAVEQFASVMHSAPDEALDHEWAWEAYDSEGVRFSAFRSYEELRELAAKIATERALNGSPPTTAHRILAQYHAAYRDLQAALLGIGPEQEDLAPAEGEWSLQEIAGHIARADIGFYVVTKYALDRYRSGDGRPAEIPDEAWDELIGQDVDAVQAILHGPLADIQSYHATFHERILQEFAGIREEELAAPSMYWEDREMSLQFRLHRFDSHMRQHTVQVDKTLESIGHPPNEARRLLRLIFAALAEAEGSTIGAWTIGADLRREAAEIISARAEEIAGILT